MEPSVSKIDLLCLNTILIALCSVVCNILTIRYEQIFPLLFIKLFDVKLMKRYKYCQTCSGVSDKLRTLCFSHKIEVGLYMNLYTQLGSEI